MEADKSLYCEPCKLRFKNKLEYSLHFGQSLHKENITKKSKEGQKETLTASKDSNSDACSEIIEIAKEKVT